MRLCYWDFYKGGAMNLKEYIKYELKKGRRDFDIGVEPDMEVNHNSPNRARFKVEVNANGGKDEM